MEKFWIRSAGRNLLSHDNGYIRVAALQGGKGSVLLDTTSVRVFVLQCFFVDPDHREIGVLQYFGEPLYGVRLTFRVC